MKLYVASSWRNAGQPSLVLSLRDNGHQVYDFRNPTSGGLDQVLEKGSPDDGFHWSDIDENWEDWSVEEYRRGLLHGLAKRGFTSDYHAMQWAEGCVLLLPSGRSAHLEGGYFVGAGKPLWVMMVKSEPELMYKMATRICSGEFEVNAAIKEFTDRTFP